MPRRVYGMSRRRWYLRLANLAARPRLTFSKVKKRASPSRVSQVLLGSPTKTPGQRRAGIYSRGLSRALQSLEFELPEDFMSLWQLGEPGSCFAGLTTSSSRQSLFGGGLSAFGLAPSPPPHRDEVLPCGLKQGEAVDMMYRDLTPEDYEMLSKLDENTPKRDTVNKSLVDSLPRVLGRDCAKTDCGVCLMDIDPDARVCQLPCRHPFHPACIEKWLTQCKNTCPLCSKPIEIKKDVEMHGKAPGDLQPAQITKDNNKDTPRQEDEYIRRAKIVVRPARHRSALA